MKTNTLNTHVKTESTTETIRAVDIKEAKEIISHGGHFLDVRSQEEIELGYIPDSEFAELETVVDSFRKTKHKNNPATVVYCHSGVRSAKAVEKLQKEFPSIDFYSLKGGIEAWSKAGEKIKTSASLTNEEMNRYSRQMLLPEIGLSGQEKLKTSKVLIVGVGGLGSPVALYLAAAGVSLGLIDADLVDKSNLQRQIIHTTSRIDMNKAESALESLRGLNPETNVILYKEWLDTSNAEEIIKNYDLVVDGTDNFPTRYLLNDIAQKYSIPLISASIIGFSGQVASFVPNEGPCYRCLYPSAPPDELAPNCSTAGVLGAMAGTIGTIQATEAVKILLGIGEPLVGRLFVYDALELETSILKVQKDPECPVCGKGSLSKEEKQALLETDYKELCRV